MSNPINRQKHSVVHVRGCNYLLEDLLIEDGETVETLMWNPIHYATYYGHLHILTYIVSELKINIGITVLKPAAESEKDPTNLATFPEDRIILLLIAIERNNFEVLDYLLNALC